MKYLFIVLMISLTNKSCSQNNKQDENILIEYSATTRGFYKHIVVNKKTIMVENSRGEKAKTQACTKTNWEKLLKSLRNINIEDIPNLKAPSDKRFFDGAAIANISIRYNDSIYKSSSFDHGNPPTEIAELVKEILSISENVE